VALDSVNGVGSVLAPEFLERRLGCQLHAINIDPKKPFPREPEPKPDVLGDLQSLVRRTGADIGFAQDPDGDRLAVVDELGNVLDNDDVLALVVRSVLMRVPGAVVVNLTTTAAIDEIAESLKSPVYRAPVGEANVVQIMQAVKARVGGEGTGGGIILPSVHLCRDSYSAMAFILEHMATTGRSVSQLARDLPHFHRRLGKAPFEHGKLGRLMHDLQRRFPDARVDRMDGLKLSWPDRWIHVRASNTEPILRLAAEARTEEAVEHLYSSVEQAVQ
jgi:phosphomannomutase